MPDVNPEATEIELHGVEDSTEFSDSEQIPVDHVNFEFEQANRFRGVQREITIFNDSQCYQKVKLKHQRKYKFRLDLSYLDPRPFRNRKLAWPWLVASVAMWLLAVVFAAAGWLDTSSINLMGSFVGIVITAIMTLLAFFHLSRDTVYFRSQFGKIRLLELENRRPDRASFSAAINKIVTHIKKSKAAKAPHQGKLLTAELKELRRLKGENIVPEESYEKAKQLIFRHEAFKSAE